jgi:hypothetical protein
MKAALATPRRSASSRKAWSVRSRARRPFYTAVYSVLDGNEQNPRIKLFETFGATVQAL